VGRGGVHGPVLLLLLLLPAACPCGEEAWGNTHSAPWGMPHPAQHRQEPLPADPAVLHQQQQQQLLEVLLEQHQQHHHHQLLLQLVARLLLVLLQQGA